MKAVVCDTGPVNYLIQINVIDVINRLFTAVLLPSACHLELMQPKAPEVVRDWATDLPGWVKVCDPKAPLREPLNGLSFADLEVLSPAGEQRALVLMDDLAGRIQAKSAGLQVIGTLGIVELAENAAFCPWRKRWHDFGKPISESRRTSSDK
jgi:predicted nucleic acid-binding protein